MRRPYDPLGEFTRPDYRTKYKVGDCVETLLGDIGYITCVSFYSNSHYKYCIRCNEDKDVRVCEWQIKGRKD